MNQGPSTLTLVIDERQGMNRFIDAPQFGDRLGQLRWALRDLKGSHDRIGLHDAEFQGSGQSQCIVPVILDESGIDLVPRNSIQEAVIGTRVDAPISRATNICNTR